MCCWRESHKLHPFLHALTRCSTDQPVMSKNLVSASTSVAICILSTRDWKPSLLFFCFLPFQCDDCSDQVTYNHCHPNCIVLDVSYLKWKFQTSRRVSTFPEALKFFIWLDYFYNSKYSTFYMLFAIEVLLICYCVSNYLLPIKFWGFFAYL